MISMRWLKREFCFTAFFFSLPFFLVLLGRGRRIKWGKELGFGGLCNCMRHALYPFAWCVLERTCYFVFSDMSSVELACWRVCSFRIFIFSSLLANRHINFTHHFLPAIISCFSLSGQFPIPIHLQILERGVFPVHPARALLVRQFITQQTLDKRKDNWRGDAMTAAVAILGIEREAVMPRPEAVGGLVKIGFHR